MGDLIFERITAKYNNLDFPFYRHNPKIPKIGWFILFLIMLLGFMLYVMFLDYSEFLSSLMYFLFMFLPLLYFSKWDYSILMHKPTKREIILAVTMFISYIIYVLIMSIIMDFIGLGDTGTSTAGAVSLETLVSLIFSMMNEELIKFIPLMFFMRLFYKYSENRNVSFILSSLIVLVGFGLLHYDGNTAIYSVLLYQGFGTIFEVYGYYKTRNLLVPYLSHLLTDAFLLSLTLL